MTGPAAPAGPHTDAVVAVIEGLGLLVGRGEAPDGSGWQGPDGTSEYKPYLVLWPTAGDTAPASLGEPHGYLDYTWQLIAVGATQDGATTAMDLAKGALVGQRLPVAGRSSYLVQMTMARPADREDDITPPLHFQLAEFSVRTEPA